MNPLAWAALMAMIVSALGGTWLIGYRAGGAECREKVAAINAAVQADALETARRVDKLHVELESLRARPERIRTVVKEVKVDADADCKSLPPSYRSLWNARPREAEPASPAAVGDAGVPGVAGADRDGKGRD